MLISVLVHLLIIGVALFSWKTNSAPKTITPPKYIEAKLVKLKTQTKTAPSKKQSKKIDLTKRKEAQEEAKRKAREAAEKKARAQKQKREKEKLEKQKREAEERKRREQERLKEQQRQKMLADMEKAKQEEEAANEQRMAEEAQSYIDAISQKIEQNWSRPPSARNGMTCRLLIQLVPTGRVVSVSVVESSGNSAFDRSAELAVQKAEVFPVVKQMSPDVFERYYRRLNLIFNPQDLRQ